MRPARSVCLSGWLAVGACVAAFAKWLRVPVAMCLQCRPHTALVPLVVVVESIILPKRFRQAHKARESPDHASDICKTFAKCSILLS